MKQKFQVNWRGRTFVFWPDDRLILTGPGFGDSSITLWPPTETAEEGRPFRDRWVADSYVGGVGFMQGKGATPQAALDALDRELPKAPMVSGGVC